MDNSWHVDKELQRTLSKTKFKQIEGVTQDLIIDIFADFSKGKKDTNSKEEAPILLERWTLQFTSG